MSVRTLFFVKQRKLLIVFFCSDELGLHLVIDKVKSDSPAWAGGLRPLDCIVSIHGWIISRMKEAEAS